MKKITIYANLLFFMVFSPCCLSFETNNPVRGEIKKYTVQIIREIPHHFNRFTQGLIFYEEKIYESTGLIGQSTLRRVDAKTGAVEKVVHVPGVFAEGLARWNNRLIQLTWKDRMAIVYDLFDFSKIGIFTYETQGWGLTSDNRHLIMSDGTDQIYFRNPDSFKVERSVRVLYHGNPLSYINELEYAGGLIHANVWWQKFIVQIDPSDGTVVGHIDCGPLFHRLPPLGLEDVLNGIAFDEKTSTFYLTGKNWPKIFQVILIPEL